MKYNLTLIQPNEYNNLFSSYHYDKNITKYKKYNLPQITKLFSTSNSQNNKAFNNLKLKLKPNKLSNNINQSQKSTYPLLNTSMNNKTMTKTNINFESMPYDLKKLRNIDKLNLIKKIKNNKKDNIQQLKMVYLNLFNFKSENTNSSIINFDSFFNNIDNFEEENNKVETKQMSHKLNEINNKSIIKIINIFNETNFDKLNNDLLSINNLQQSYLNKISERLLNKYKNANNISQEENNSINSFNKSHERHNLVSNNVFLDWVLDNVKHKIELKNEYNQHLTNVWIQNLINNEFNELKNRFIEFKRSLNLSNYIEEQRKNKSFTNKIIIKKDDSYFTESTHRTNFNISKRKNSLNNNSNIMSINNNSYENEENNKIMVNKNYTLNEMNTGFDLFFYNTKRGRTIKPMNTKYITNFVLKKNIKLNTDNNNKSNDNFNKIHLKNTLIKSKNKTELDNEYHGENSNLIKNLYINNPRGKKIKSFKLNIPKDINSKIPIINNELNTSKTSSKKNFDIKEKINKISDNNNYNSTLNNNFSDDESSFASIEKARKRYKKRNSINFIPIQFTALKSLQIKIPNNNNKNITSRTNSFIKYKLKKRGSEISRKPKFINNLAYKNIVKSLYKHGKYKQKKRKDSSSDSNSSSDISSGSGSGSSSDNSYDSDENVESDENEDGYQINDYNYKNKKINQENKKKIKKKKKKNKKDKHKKNNKDNSKDNKKGNKKEKNKESNSSKDKKTKNKKSKKKGGLLNKNSIIIEENEQNMMDKLEKNELIKNLNQNFIFSKGKRNKFTSEDINQFKKIFTKKNKNKNTKDNKKENKKEKKKGNNRKSVRNSLKKDIKGVGEEEQEEEKEPSIYSISSNNDEGDDINEDLQIKNEVDIMNILLSNNESKNLFSSIFELKKQLKKKNKTEEEKEAIKENQNQIRGVVNKYFEILVSKLTNNNIINENIHGNVLNELEIIQKYGIYTNKDLKKLIKKTIEERREEDNDDDEKYNRFYHYDEYDEYFGKKEKKNKIMKKSASAEVKSKNQVSKNFVKIKFDDLKEKYQQKKNKLIYDNSYLFKDNHSDDDEQNIIIKKEIKDILDKEYNEMIKAKKEEIFKEKKRKDREVFLKKKVPFKKKSQNRQILRLVDDPINEVLLNKNIIDKEALKKELEKEKELDKKMYDFFRKIQSLKNKRDSIDQDKLNEFVDLEIEKNFKNKNHLRLFNFLEHFNLNRTIAKNNSHSNNKRIGFLSPIIFTSPNENNSINNLLNFK